MPLYEYDCEACGKRTEVLQSYREKPLKICPHCGGKMKKAFSAPAIQFKGSGWYVTDYPSQGKKEGKAKEKAESSSSSEAKPDTKEKPAETKKETKKKADG